MAEKNLDNVKINVEFEEPTEREALSSGDEVKSLFGKIKKYFTDLKLVAFSGSYNDLGDKPKSLPANGGDADTAKQLTSAVTIDGISFDGSASISRLGTCTTASYQTAKEVTLSAFDAEQATDAILYIQFTGTYEGASNDTHTISINGGDGLVIYYAGEVLSWETFFSNYPFCDGQIHQFRYVNAGLEPYLELIAVPNRAVANNLTTTDAKIALGAPMGKQLAETDASLQTQIDQLNTNIPASLAVNYECVNAGFSSGGVAYKFGNIVIIHAFFAAAAFYSGTPLFFLPEGYIPKEVAEGQIICKRITSDELYNEIHTAHVDTNGHLYQSFNSDGAETSWQGEIFMCYNI